MKLLQLPIRKKKRKKEKADEVFWVAEEIIAQCLRNITLTWNMRVILRRCTCIKYMDAHLISAYYKQDG